jgi:hypothetical protein
LKAPNTRGGSRFGGSVATDGVTLLVGARNESGSANGVDGDPDASSPDSNLSGAGYAY